MTLEKRVSAVVAALKRDYPEALCSLEYRRDYELLFSTRLAAQCTDERVNIVTKDLYEKYPSLEAFAAADIDELEAIVRPTGFFRMKARDLKAAAAMILSEYGGRVPGNMDDLLKIPGVGRKTANLVLGDVFNTPGVVVADTHCIRISNLLGFAASKDPAKVEMRLRELLPPEESNNFCHRTVLHGRAVCVARRPKCGECSLALYCDHAVALK